MDFNKAKFEKLKKAYKEAVNNKQQTFTFEDALLVTDYAKYLIECLEPLFKKK